MKTIIYDAKRAFFNNSGLGNYSRTLLENLSNVEEVKTNQLIIKLATPNIKNNCWSNFELYFQPNQLVTPTNMLFSDKLSFLWRSFSISNENFLENCDIFHGLSNELPLNLPQHIKSIVTIHDVIFLLYPKLYKFWDRLGYSLKTEHAVNNSQKIIAITRQTANDLINHLKVPPKKIEIIYQTCHQQYLENVEESKKVSIRNKYELPSSFLLCVGTIEKRKNQLIILKAIRELKLDIPLVLVGKKTKYCEEIQAYIDEYNMQNVHLIHDVSFEDLPAIYQLANLFIYPSLYEGFGIPIIEALISKIPVIASNSSCLEEAGGEESLYFSPYNHIELGHLIKTLIKDSAIRQKMIEEGLKFFEKQFSKKSTNSKLLELYQSI
ncbi:glycosyltransferase family 4 protein [Bacteriovoracaceae bacterium]|nr:glycosyltransferase family 4 protein [Bacteriovoracaceae bacterium]